MQKLTKITEPRKLPSKEWKKKYKCKKGKGDHNWAPYSIRNHLEYTTLTPYGRAWGYYCPGQPLPTNRLNAQSIQTHEMHVVSNVEWRCQACSKHKTEYLGEGKRMGLLIRTQHKKLDPYRGNLPK